VGIENAAENGALANSMEFSRDLSIDRESSAANARQTVGRSARFAKAFRRFSQKIIYRKSDTQSEPVPFPFLGRTALFRF